MVFTDVGKTRPGKRRWYFSLSPAGKETGRKMGLFISALWLTGSRSEALCSDLDFLSHLHHEEPVGEPELAHLEKTMF